MWLFGPYLLHDGTPGLTQDELEAALAGNRETDQQGPQGIPRGGPGDDIAIEIHVQDGVNKASRHDPREATRKSSKSEKQRAKEAKLAEVARESRAAEESMARAVRLYKKTGIAVGPVHDQTANDPTNYVRYRESDGLF